MRILVIGATGTIGKRLTPVLAQQHDIIMAGRNSGDVRVDISSEQSIHSLFKQINNIDACICIAASGPLDNFATLTEEKLLADFKGKLFGQMNIVLIGQHHINNNGCFTLTSGIFADIPYKGVTGGGIISGALHSFVLSASIELPRHIRINAVSPGLAEDSAKEYGHLFPGMPAVPMDKLIAAYAKTINENITGQILRVYE